MEIDWYWAAHALECGWPWDHDKSTCINHGQLLSNFLSCIIIMICATFRYPLIFSANSSRKPESQPLNMYIFQVIDKESTGKYLPIQWNYFYYYFIWFSLLIIVVIELNTKKAHFLKRVSNYWYVKLVCWTFVAIHLNQMIEIKW